MNERTVRRRLDEERKRLLQLIEDDTAAATASGGSAAEELSTMDQHPADLATDTFERSKEQSIREQAQVRLKDVEDALHRLEEGSYGVCEVCGKRISAERLEALPAAGLCVKDQRSLERAAAADRSAAAGPVAAA